MKHILETVFKFRTIDTHIGILGAGGFGREVLHWSYDDDYIYREARIRVVHMYDGTVTEKRTLDNGIVISNEIQDIPYVIGVGEPSTKLKLLSKVDTSKMRFERVVHSKAIFGERDWWRYVGEGSVICPGVIITTNVRIGKFVTLNLNATVGHDTVIGDYCNFAPGANISGNCTIGNRVSVGTNAAIREKITVCDDVVIGMGGIVVKDITEPGVYVGNPARKIK